MPNAQGPTPIPAILETMSRPIPDYRNLDQSGDAERAAWRMEMRSVEPASDDMFKELVRPLLADVSRVLEFGCGTAALSRRIAAAKPEASVLATDASGAMVKAARELASSESAGNLRVEVWDVRNPDVLPDKGPFDLIVSSVVVRYLDEEEARSAIAFLAGRLAPGGIIAFVEQDLATDSLYSNHDKAVHRIFNKEFRQVEPWTGLGLFTILSHQGLSLLPRKSFIWTTQSFGPYMRELTEQMARHAVAKDRITQEEMDDFLADLEALAASGAFYYGLVYHLIAARTA